MASITLEQAISLAMEHHTAGQLAEAEAIYRQILAQNPNHADALHLLGVLAGEAGQLELAVDLLSRAVTISPTASHYHSNAGELLRRLGRLDEAITACRMAIQYNPGSAAAYCNLGAALNDATQYDESIAVCRKAIQLKPELAENYKVLAYALKMQGRLDEAIDALHQALQIRPQFAKALNNLAVCYKDQGKLDEALGCMRKSMAVEPHDADIHSNVVYTLCFHPDYDAKRILQESLVWARQHAAPLAGEIRVHENDRSPDRRLRIGYVSPNFQAHAAACFLHPLLSHHNKQNVQVFCYARVVCPDDMTRQLSQLADVWRPTAHLSDAQLAEQIRRDQIDILVDLTLHMAGSRLLVFARKPAPIQVTWLGYPGTTGMETMDYRLTDPWLDPPGEGDELYTEQSIRLPKTFWCYKPMIATADVNELPALTNGYVTFGCFNNYCKVTEPALLLWIEALRSVPRSRMVIQSQTSSHLDAVRQLFEAQGIASDRLQFVDKTSLNKYFKLYHRLDICLDPIPCPGHTSTLDGFWMGVPVVTLAGQTAVARGGVSLLNNVGLPELISRSTGEYVTIAGQLARDFPKLAKIRAGLRERMLQSSLMDGAQFAADIEAVYRQMWKKWCTSR